MTGHNPELDAETEAAIDRALDAAQLRAGDATASVLHIDRGDATVDDAGDGD